MIDLLEIIINLIWGGVFIGGAWLVALFVKARGLSAGQSFLSVFAFAWITLSAAYISYCYTCLPSFFGLFS